MTAGTPNPPSAGPRRRARPWRWVVLATILALASAAGSWIWLGERMRQQKVVSSIMLLFVTLVVLLLWIVLASRLRRAMRLGLLLAIAVVVVAATQTLRIRGVSGDLVPIVTWRWSAEPETTLPVPVATGRTGMHDPVWPLGVSSYPQFLGPERVPVLRGLELQRDWSTRPPRALWRQPIGAGWSAFAVVGGRAVTQEQRGEDEMVVCYELVSGAVLWAHRDRARYSTTLGGTGPRATPTIDERIVYTIGATGILNALDLATGALLWSVDTLDDNDAAPLDWGTSGSPLVVDDLVIVNPGGTRGRSVVAYDRQTGERRWASGSDRASYASPTLLELAGRPQVVMVNAQSVTAHEPQSGELLWRFEWPGQTPKVAQPLALPGDRLVVSAGYGLGAIGLHVTAQGQGGLAVEPQWRSRRLKAKFTNVVHHDGFIYGLDDGVLV
ncbi:MAG: outer membrane protein assembly factor BamB family protein, partial [Planctomycetota bacterium]